MAIDNWSDEECRYFFHLYADEKRKGNKTKLGMNQTGKDFIIKKFEEKFGRGFLQWEKFKNKYDSSRKAWAKFNKLTHNRTGLGYDDMGRLDMSDDWWDQRVAEWPGARKYREKPTPNMDLFEGEFGGITVTGAEGWSAQQGEASLNSRVNENNEDEADSVDTDMGVPETQTQAVGKQTQGGSSRTKRRRKEKDVIIETSVARNTILAQKNKIAEQMLEREYAYSVERVLEVLSELPGVRKWSPFHRASVDHLLADAANRQGFVAFPSVEDKISYLEHRTGTKLYD